MDDLNRFKEAIENVTGADGDRVVHYQRLLYGAVDLRGKSLLDVGGGGGLVAFYAALSGAQNVVCLEPTAAGSSGGNQERFEQIRKRTGAEARFVNARLEDWTEPSDVVVLNNVINHLDEDTCMRLHRDGEARKTYSSLLERIRDLTRGCLVVADCSRRNLWGDLHLPNPFSPNIEWHKHQSPRLWAEMLEGIGLITIRLIWNAPARLGAVGQTVLGNRVGGYCTNSHFILTLGKEEEISL